MRLRFALVIGLAVSLLIGVSFASGSPARGRGHSGKLIRWDLAQVVAPPGAVLAGGTNVARDAATHDSIELSASSGQAEPKQHHGEAAGGGRFVHRHQDGTEVGHGVYVVTGFESWTRRQGTFPAPIDGIGEAPDASAGVLQLDIRLLPAGGTPVDGVLTIFCHFPDTPGPNDEGVRVQFATFDFRQESGVTLFHVLK